MDGIENDLPHEDDVTNSRPIVINRRLIIYAALGILIISIIGIGAFIGYKYYFYSALEVAEKDGASETETAEFEYTYEELQLAKSKVLMTLKSEFGFISRHGTDLYIDGEDTNVVRAGETLHNMHIKLTELQAVFDVSGEFITQKESEELYWSQSMGVNSEKHGVILIGSSDIGSLPLVSWVTIVDGVPLILSASFNKEDVSTSDVQNEFDTNAPLLLTSVLELFPSEADSTRKLLAGIDAVRAQHNGYATTKILRDESHTSGSRFTLTEYDNSKVSNSCEMFVSGWPLEQAKKLASCEVKIVTETTEQVYADEQLMTLGGLPDKWISSSEIVTRRAEVADGFYQTQYYSRGIFDVDTKTFSEVIRVEKPAIYWRRALIEYEFEDVSKRLLFVEGDSSYYLYEIQTERELSDYFIDLDSAGSMVDYLDPRYSDELVLIGDMPLPDSSRHAFKIGLNNKKEIVFELLASDTDSWLTYIYMVDQNVISPSTI